MFSCKVPVGLIFLCLFQLIVLISAKEYLSKSKKGGGSCTLSKDCNYHGICRSEGDSAFCFCFDGIRGENCDVIEDCADNPTFCGTTGEPTCDYDRKTRQAYCHCEEEGKRYDVDKKKCVEQKHCEKQSDCVYGTCGIVYEEKKEKEYCDCFVGTSGDFCERVTECERNPSFCGDGADVECRFNTFLSKPYCHCKNGTQRFDQEQKKCVTRETCREHDQCLPFGVCTEKCQHFEPCYGDDYFEGKRTCHCVEGTSGENCKMIDDCYNKVVDCGTGDNVVCTYRYISGISGRAHCKCLDSKQTFNSQTKACEDRI